MAEPTGHLNLALLIECYDPRAGGAERSAAQIVDALLARGHRVTVLTGQAPADAGMRGDAQTSQSGSASGKAGLSIRTAPTGRARGVLGLAAFARWARQQLAASDSFDTSLSFTTTLPAAVVQPRAGLVVQSQHRRVARQHRPLARFAKATAIALSARQQLLRQLERMTLRDPRVQRLVAISTYMARDFQRYYGVGRDRIELIPNAAEMKPVAPEQRRRWRERIRRMFAIAEDRVALLFPAIDPWRKGLRPLVLAMRRLIEREAPVVLMLAGSEAYSQHALVVEAGIRDHVRIIGSTQQMEVLYCAADLTVLPTFHDPASKVVIESLMMGTPAISTAYNGSSDFITGPDVPEPRGRVVADPADDNALAQAIIEMLDPETRRRCAAATAGLAEQLTMARHVERLERVLWETVSSATAATAAEAAPRLS